MTINNSINSYQTLDSTSGPSFANLYVNGASSVSNRYGVFNYNDGVVSGYRFSNANGYFDLINNSSTPGQFNPRINFLSNGSNQACLASSITTDSGSAECLRIEANIGGNSSVSNRPLIGFYNYNSSPLVQLTANGNLLANLPILSSSATALDTSNGNSTSLFPNLTSGNMITVGAYNTYVNFPGTVTAYLPFLQVNNLFNPVMTLHDTTLTNIFQSGLPYTNNQISLVSLAGGYGNGFKFAQKGVYSISWNFGINTSNSGQIQTYFRENDGSGDVGNLIGNSVVVFGVGFSNVFMHTTLSVTDITKTYRLVSTQTSGGDITLGSLTANHAFCINYLSYNGA